MKTILVNISLIIFILLGCSSSDEVETPNKPGNNGDNYTIKGSVKSSNTGIANVVVTDGANFTTTDKDGNYSFKISETATHVYISSPSGYTVPVQNSVPIFYTKLTPSIREKAVNFELIKLSSADEKHYFIAVGDPQVRNETELKKLKPILDFMKTDIASSSFNPVHLMVTGDIVFDTPNMHDLSKQYFTAVGQAVYYSIGNHDHLQRKDAPATDQWDGPSAKTYIEHYGPTYYSFNRGKAHYIIFDNILYAGGPNTEYSVFITQEQLDWIKKDLEFVPKDHVLILMTHSPTKSRYKSNYGNSSALYALLDGYKNVHIITGHTHYNSVMADQTNITDHIIGAACGGWWEGPVCPDGAYLGYKIFEINGTNVKWKYRSYEFPKKQFSVFKPGKRESELIRPSQELLVNVWDWDIHWKVEWSENGGTFKEMPRYTSRTYDPISFEYFGAEGDTAFPPGRTWIGASPTDHIFTGVPSATTTTVTIKATNPFGEEFIEDIQL
ncbi:calcineurin-like phosphoesterase family protein [Dysgonomonas sp. BGC7]|uniref:calcineurin-like phosphoesterase C-terminal domain-containing protein n=1 Tax=Dysgonomonas sp. BGC7 TaxID=1658008 RepID=UPI000682275C|nr:calcineurin-like phosphoesterase family protein [Dysgonomonas sp. BGC7]MBD8387267.1 calcineurin-like phosphoesterase C-terminal domain-containing protein [Dysgonomonas sp. BGC7]